MSQCTNGTNDTGCVDSELYMPLQEVRQWVDGYRVANYTRKRGLYFPKVSELPLPAQATIGREVFAWLDMRDQRGSEMSDDMVYRLCLASFGVEPDEEYERECAKKERMRMEGRVV